jgi:hypothetical protein
VVESTALEMRRTGNRTVGSNPTLSASVFHSSTLGWATQDTTSAKLKLLKTFGEP